MRVNRASTTPSPGRRSGSLGAVLLLAVPALLVSSCDGVGDASRAEPQPPDSGFVRNGRAEIFYRSLGQGPPLVVIHGGPALEHTYLAPGLEPLSRNARIVFYDQRGSGRSEAPLDSVSITLDNFLGDLEALQDTLGYDEVNLLAHSWGGVLGILYASSRPERVRSLILMSSVEPGQRYAQETRRRQRERMGSFTRGAIRAMVASEAYQRREPSVVEEVYRRTFAASFAEPDSVEKLPVDFTERTARAAGTLPELLLTPVMPYDFWGRLDDIPVPALVVHGAEDPIPTAMAREMARQLPEARLVVLEGVGHFPFVEAPDRLHAAVRAFLDEHGG